MRALQCSSAAVLMLCLSACDAPRAVTMSSASDAASPEAEVLELEGSTQDVVLQPRFIRNATTRIEVTDVDAAVGSLRASAARVGGIVAEAEVSVHSGARSASLLLRIPADSLDDFLDGLTALGAIQSTSVSSVDVSREYFDTETRLAVKEETVRRLTELVQRSGSVEDLVAVERELSRTMTELESMKGQIRYFDLKIAQSDVRVYLHESGSAASTALQRVRSAMGEAVDVLGQSIAALVYIVVFLIPWAVIAMLAWLVFKRVAHARRKKVEAASDRTA